MGKYPFRKKYRNRRFYFKHLEYLLIGVFVLAASLKSVSFDGIFATVLRVFQQNDGFIYILYFLLACSVAAMVMGVRRLTKGSYQSRPVSLVRKESKAQGQWEKGLIHRTSSGIHVRSKSEVIVYEALISHGLDVRYEETLRGKDLSQRSPDFTVRHNGKVWYWEHLGMLEDAGYREKWELKQQWYKNNGYWDQLITTQDHTGGVVYGDEIKEIIRCKIFGESA